MPTPTHRVTLTYRYGGTTCHEVVDADVGLRWLATINPTAVAGHAVILDREQHAGRTLVGLGWTAEFVRPIECIHPRLAIHSDYAAMDYRATCRTCCTSWTWDGVDIPNQVRIRATPVWEEHGL